MMNDLGAINRRRAKRRRILALAGLPLVALTLLFGLKVGSMYIFTSLSINSYNGSDFNAASQNAERTKIINIFETWKAPFNTGTSLISLGAYDGAVDNLKDSLQLFLNELHNPNNPQVHAIECKIRGNLGVAYEGKADLLIVDKRFDEAQKVYDESLDVMESCEDNDSVSESIERVQGKKNGDEAEDEPEPSEEQQEEIEQQLNDNNEKQEEDESSSGQSEDGDDGGSSSESEQVDKPW